ncbi:MAG: HK97 family phage prohead protease [Taibaiella sp.]|nr:HK97 family phage prohead protease [Taibaiella sp.]
MLYKGIDVGVMKDINVGKRTAVLKYATYGSLDRDKDRANKGMFTKSWNDGFDDIRFFKNHNKQEAPGKPLRFWEDDNHAYAEVWLGTHTLGEDTLKMMDEGIMTNNSYGFDPQVSNKIKEKGMDFKQVKLWEISVLTHWGAHPESKVQMVDKEAAEIMELKQYLSKLDKFIRNTSASDESIEEVLALKQSGEEILKKYDTVVTPTDDDQEEQAASVEKEFADALYLLTLKI